MGTPALTAEQLKIVVVGHVDHGKSTLIGRLLHDTGSLMEGRFEKIQAACSKRGMPFEWAFLLDALQAERDQNITIDTAHVFFRTARRPYVLIDAPGHREFLKNMVTGAASAEAALLLIDASEGIQEQSRRHLFLLSLLGIGQIAVLVNKMDLVGYRQSLFDGIEQECRKLMQQLKVPPALFIPVSAALGDNVAARSARMPWYRGPALLEALDLFKARPPADDLPLRFPLQDVYHFDRRRILAAPIESGTLRVGSRVKFSPGGKTATVKSIEGWPEGGAGEARAGQSVGITLTEQIYVDRGQIGSHEDDAPTVSDRFSARLFWMGRQNLEVGRKVKLKLATQEVECQVGAIDKLIDASSLSEIEHVRRPHIARHDVAEVILCAARPVAFDPYDRIEPTGRFVLVDQREVCGGGIILEARPPQRPDPLHEGRSRNLFWSTGKISRDARERRNGHKGAVLWLTGLPASGKSTLATELERELFEMGLATYVLDGDNIRHGLCADLDFSPAARAENIRRVAEVAKLFASAGVLVITAFISPYRRDRHLARSILHQGEFIEVHVDAPLEVCEQRDPKGLYRKARAGQLPEFTGVSAPYEAPENAEIVVHTDRQSAAECVAAIIDFLKIAHLEPRQ